MAKMLVVGRGAQDTAAIGLMIDRCWPGAGIVALVRTPDRSLPAQEQEARGCDSCLIDLAGVGMQAHSAGAQTDLMAFLAGRAAILLLPAGGTGWSQCALPAAPGQTLIRLPAACTATELGEALYQLRAAMERDRRTAQRDPPAALASAGSPVQSRASAHGHVAMPLRAKPMHQGVTAGIQVQRHARLAASAPVVFEVFPEIVHYPLIAALARALEHSGCIKMTLPGRDVSPMVIHVEEGWVASRMTAFALRTSAMNQEIMAASRIEHFTPAQLGDVLAQEFGDRRFSFHPLDRLVWDVLHDEMGRRGPERHQDLSMKIVRFPNFNLMRSFEPGDIQMAALCARAPETISGLERRFAGNKRAVRRFAIAAILSGHATATPARGTTGEPHLSSRTRPGAPETKARRGLFQSLLDRLF